MKRVVLLLMVFCSAGMTANESKQTQTQLLDCNIIFDQRKDEIRQELQAIDERQQALQVFQNATQVLLEEKSRKLSEQESSINEKILEFQKAKEQAKAEFQKSQEQAELDMKAREEYIQDLIAKNEEILRKMKKNLRQIKFG